jgi:hypothetical protein
MKRTTSGDKTRWATVRPYKQPKRRKIPTSQSASQSVKTLSAPSAKPVVTPYTPDPLRPAGATTAFPAFEGDPPPGDAKYIELPTEVPDALPNGKIPVAVLEGDLVVECDAWPGDSEFEGTRPGDIYILYINGTESGFEWDVPSPMPLPGEKMHVEIPKDYLDALPEGTDTPLLLQIAMIGMPGENFFIYNPFNVHIDKRTPGADRVPPIEFEESIVLTGLTLAKLLKMPGQVLPGTIAVYNDQQAGDTLYVFMRLRSTGAVWPLGPYTVTSPTAETVLAFTRADLEKVDGVGVVDFYYYIVDDVGWQSVNSNDSPVNMLIKDAPEDLPAPIVPGFFDDLVTDKDARPSLEIWIPACTPPAQVGDYFIVSVGGGGQFATDPLGPSDIGNNPLLRFPFPYSSLARVDAGFPIYTADVAYELIRNGLSSPSNAKPVDFDLTLPGGPDPNPDPDPGVDPPNPNDALDKPTLIGASGDKDILPPGDASSPAAGEVPWYNDRNNDAFEEGDRIQLYIDGTTDDNRVGAEYVVTGADVLAKDDLRIAIPAGELLPYPGEHRFLYAATRRLAIGQDVTAYSPSKDIIINAEGELPGGGEPMLEAVFAGWRIPNPRRNYAIGATSFVNGSTPVRVRLAQVNVAAGDTIQWKLTAHKYDRSNPNNPVLNRYPDGDMDSSMPGKAPYVIKAGDLDPLKPDDSLPHPPQSPPARVERAYVDLPFTRDELIGILDGAADFEYTITNSVGISEPSVNTRILIDLR